MMLCSNCSDPVRPIVSVDIDGVLGRHHEQFQQFASLYLGRDLRKNYDGSCEFSDWLELDKVTYRQIKLAYRQGGVKRWMRPYSGAVLFMQDLRDLGVEIWICTTRPWDRLDNIDPDTRFWLDEKEVPYDHLLYGEDKYEKLAEQVDGDRVVGVVEDLLSQCLLAQSQFGEVVWQPIRDHTSDLSQHYVHRFGPWYGVSLSIEERIKSWR